MCASAKYTRSTTTSVELWLWKHTLKVPGPGAGTSKCASAVTWDCDQRRSPEGPYSWRARGRGVAAAGGSGVQGGRRACGQ
jgi:hypothetical protein